MVDAELHEPDERAATIDPSARDGLIQSTVQRNPKARAKNTSFLPRSCSRRNGKRTEPFLQRTESAGSHAPGGRPWPTGAHPRRQAAAPLSPANHAGLDWSSAALHTVLPQITESLGISISEGWSQIRGPGAPIMAGFENLETTLQYQLLKDNARTGDAFGLGRRVGRHRRDQCGHWMG